MGYVLRCKGCGQTFNVVDDHKLEKWEYEYCRYKCFNLHNKPKIIALALKHNMTVDQLRELYFDCGDLFLGDWFPLNRYNPDNPHETHPDIVIRRRNWKKGVKP